MSTVPPADAKTRQQAPAIVCYNVESVPRRDEGFLQEWRSELSVIDTVVVAPRDASTFRVPAGHGFRILSVEGSQVGDLNLWNANDGPVCHPEEQETINVLMPTGILNRVGFMT